MRIIDSQGNTKSYRTHEIIDCFNELTNQLDAFESLEITLPKALPCMVRLIPFYSVVVIETRDSKTKELAWHDPNSAYDFTRQTIADAEEVFDNWSLPLNSKLSESDSPISTKLMSLRIEGIEEQHSEHSGYNIAHPLKVGNSPIFGLFQIRCVSEIDETALGFINAFANRLAISMDRDFILKNQIKIMERERSAQSKALALQRMNDEAIAAITAKSQFLANMSHEIRTPLGIILGFAELLAISDHSDQVRSKFFETIKKNGHVLTHLIDDILDLAKVEEGKIDLEKHIFSLTDILDEITSTFAIKAAEKGIAFKINVEKNVPLNLQSDSLRLKQILINIISNAIKFTVEGSVAIHVEALESQQGQKIAFHVIDTGRGISSEEEMRLFQPFAQADSTTTRQYGGTGLGLILSKRLAIAMGGDVVLNSSECKVGSTFTITVALELPQMNEVSGEAEFQDPTWSALRDISVLLVDDAKDNVMLFEAVLQGHGAKVDTASNGIEAVSKALKKNYDIVLMDLQMPLMDGFTAASELRLRGYRKPILALTALAMKEEREKAIRAGCNDHLAKPVDAKQLVRKVVDLTGPTILH